MEKKIEIAYEDNEVLVVIKPAGIVTTNEGKKEEESIEKWLIKNRQNGLKREGIVHRLDKGTSGLLVVAKTAEALEELQRQFKKREVEKRYWALVRGEAPNSGEIEMPIGRSGYAFARFSVNPEGKPAKTLFWVKDKYRKDGKIFSLVEILLKTGRTHQIRVHLSYLGWPIVGDKLYGDKIGSLNRPFLHAQKIGFWQPKSRKRIELVSNLASELTEELKGYEKI
jgi:23S rRNA pseudouridine1911/1915/1917 synthase